jgi:PAS domain S-box-containing protein
MRTIAMDNRPGGTAEAIAYQVSAALLAADPSGRIIFTNPAAERLWGYAAGGMLGLPFTALVASAPSLDFDRLGRQSCAAQTEVLVEAEGLRRDGSSFPLELRVVHAEGRVIVAAQDVTQRRAVERQLWRAVETAEGNARAKSQMLATLSHEIRNPLGAVLGWVEILGYTQLDADQRRLCQAIERNSNALITLLNDILDYSKGEAHKIALEKAPFDLESLLAEVTELFGESAAKKELDLDCRVDPRLPRTVCGDALRLRQILINLVANAVKFTERGSVRMRVSRGETADTFRFEVADTGIGVAAEAQGHIFEAFSQGSADTSRRYGGSGLGLAICRQLVELMGGQIGFDSGAGRGSTFWFTVPLSQPDRAVATAPAPRPARLRVLIAEDNPANRIVAVGLVEKLGHDAVTVDTGSEAVAAVLRDRYDVILMDIWMPEMDGLAAARRIEETCPAESRPRIIAVTADATTETRTRCALVGMVDYVTKPLSLERLRHALEHAVSTTAH